MAKFWIDNIPVKYIVEGNKIKIDTLLLEDVINDAIEDELFNAGFEIDVNQEFRFSDLELLNDIKFLK